MQIVIEVNWQKSLNPWYLRFCAKMQIRFVPVGARSALRAMRIV